VRAQGGGGGGGGGSSAGPAVPGEGTAVSTRLKCLNFDLKWDVTAIGRRWRLSLSEEKSGCHLRERVFVAEKPRRARGGLCLEVP